MYIANLPQQETINQYTGDGSTTTFNYTYLLLVNTDIAVYLTLTGNTPNPNTDLQQLNVNYTVTGVGTTSGGTVVFTTAPPAGSTITLSRDMQYSIDTDFAAPQTLNGANLDSAFERTTMLTQQLNTGFLESTIKYKANEILGTSPPIPAKTLMVPPVNPGDFWLWNGTAWTIGNLPSGQIPGADLALVIAQLQALIVSAGITFLLADPTQTKSAVANYCVYAGLFQDDSSIPNNVIPMRTPQFSFPLPTKLTANLTMDIIVQRSNTGNVTVTFLNETHPLLMPLGTGTTQVPFGYLKGYADDNFAPIYRINFQPGYGWVIISAPNTISADVEFITPTSGNTFTVSDERLSNGSRLLIWQTISGQVSPYADGAVVAIGQASNFACEFMTANSVGAGQHYRYMVL